MINRWKAGTAQKLVLNIITTATMVKIRKVKGNKIINMQLSNHKLVYRGVKMIMNQLQIARSKDEYLLQKHGSDRASINTYHHGD